MDTKTSLTLLLEELQFILVINYSSTNLFANNAYVSFPVTFQALSFILYIRLISSRIEFMDLIP